MEEAPDNKVNFNLLRLMNLNFLGCSIAMLRDFLPSIGSDLGFNTPENKALLDILNKLGKEAVETGLTNRTQSIVLTEF